MAPPSDPPSTGVVGGATAHPRSGGVTGAARRSRSKLRRRDGATLPAEARIERRRLRVAASCRASASGRSSTGSRAAHGLGGFVLNDGEGVLIEAEGEPARARRLRRARCATEAPPLARVDAVAAEAARAARRARGSRSRRAGRPAGTALIPADVATCDDCLRELLRPGRPPLPLPVRQLHAVRAAVHDRARASRTTGRTRRWPASRCAPTAGASTRIPADRRFHAEPIACPACGPRLSLPLEEAVALLRGRRDRRGQGARRLPPRLRRRRRGARSRGCAPASTARTSRSR